MEAKQLQSQELDFLPRLEELEKKEIKYTSVSQHIDSFYEVAQSVVLRVDAIESEKKKVILIVDDEPLTFELIEEFLEEAGISCEAVRATNGLKAQTLALALHPNLIITDWLMPEMDGLELIKNLRQHDSTNEIPVLLTTGMLLSESQRDQALTAGAFDCIRKPLSFTELKARVKAALALDQFFQEVKRHQRERDLIANGLEKLRLELEVRNRELALHTELLVLCKGSRERLVESIGRLQPFLTHEGRSKLSALLRQFHWELNEETSLSIEKKFDELHANLFNLLEKTCPTITKNEKRLCAYLVMNHCAADIARVTGKSLNSINVGFARLRLKLGLPNNKDLRSFLKELIPSSFSLQNSI